MSDAFKTQKPALFWKIGFHPICPGWCCGKVINSAAWFPGDATMCHTCNVGPGPSQKGVYHDSMAERTICAKLAFPNVTNFTNLSFPFPIAFTIAASEYPFKYSL